jgi:hypothetical protein
MIYEHGICFSCQGLEAFPQSLAASKPGYAAASSHLRFKSVLRKVAGMFSAKRWNERIPSRSSNSSAAWFPAGIHMALMVQVAQVVACSAMKAKGGVICFRRLTGQGFG